MKKEMHLLSIIMVGLAATLLSSCGIKPQRLEPPSSQTSPEKPQKSNDFPSTYPKM